MLYYLNSSCENISVIIDNILNGASKAFKSFT